jgi:hypothetical protein
MKHFLAHGLMALAALSTSVWAGDAATLSGKVLEIKSVDSYTYLRLKTKDGETWAAVEKANLEKGASVTLENIMVMRNFESKALKKTFPSIVFGNLAGTKVDQGNPHGSVALAPDVGPIKVPKATGANAYTVAEVVTTSAKLKDQPVQVRGKVVKFNAEVMGKNWVHLRDGSGKAEDGSHDILVTTLSQAKVGDVVTATGKVRTDKDFGSGYAYKVLIEEATLTP